jgi:hypothetical protein
LTLCRSPFHVAFNWCTGIPHTRTEDEHSPRALASFDVTSTVTCHDVASGDYQKSFGTMHMREGEFLYEARSLEPGNQFEFGPGPWLPLLVTARHRTLQFFPNPNDPCSADTVVDSDDSAAISVAISPAQTTEYQRAFKDSPEIPRCGALQRVSVWQGDRADCETVANDLFYKPKDYNTYYPETGEYINQFETGDHRPACYVKEPRTFWPHCTDATSTCNAGWQCVPGVPGQPGAPVRRIERPMLKEATP